jgi:hypothetical protein
MYQTEVLVDAKIYFYPAVPLVEHLGLVPLWVTLPVFIFGGGGRREASVLKHCHAPSAEVNLDGFDDLVTQLVLLQQMPEGQDHCLIGDPVAEQLDFGKAPHGRAPRSGPLQSPGS